MGEKLSLVFANSSGWHENDYVGESTNKLIDMLSAHVSCADSKFSLPCKS
jgi:hypothetical protein